MYMDFFEIVNKRRSVRKFTKESIPEDVMRKTLSISLQAANSSNPKKNKKYWNGKFEMNVSRDKKVQKELILLVGK